MSAGPEAREARLAALVTAEALSWLGTPYRHQASRRGVGCDCLGLVLGVWRALYGAAPEAPGPYAGDWAEPAGTERLLAAAWRHCRPAAEPACGTILLFRWRPGLPAKHAGIALDPARFVHAYQGHSVTISWLVPQWRRRIAGVFRFPLPPDGGPGATG
ncbi:NlpC/P60 family protein [Aquibium sp. A9E412]|uniref:NlpC/P60 family protein n=1 Tax=Aquibium sp. A9E412 TaxID=2976767 RepID=UPI0025B01C50|nr:NlpC/P60 family protein [Aquibium sp. A9E412]MDN2567998.1 NlpC/P60 family protein [Aquibium sp. A9E412]